jgi:hypothetical protein
MKKIVILLLVVAPFVIFLVGCAKEQGKPQTTCPVDDQPINRKFYVDFAIIEDASANNEGKRIYFCSEACVKKFNGNPNTYIEKLKKQGVILENVP